MKILHVITTLYTGGAEKLLVDLVPLLNRNGNQADLCVFDGTRTAFYEDLEKSGVRIYTFTNKNKPYSICNLIKLIKLMQQDYDVVHAHITAPQLFVAIGKHFCNAKIITTEHSTSNRRRNKKWAKPIDKWMFSQYDKHIMISDKCEANHRNYIGDKYCKNLITVYNGIDYTKYKNSTPNTEIRNLSKKIIVNVASYSAPKDQPTLIKAMQYIPDNFHLCLVGDGPRRAEYESLISEMRLINRVHLLGLRKDIQNILAASDYVVMCSHYEGLSLSSLEGMASGKPFLASDVDGLHEIVEGNGVLFKHEDAKGFADAIMKLEGSEEYRKEVIQKCQKKAAQYDINVMAEKYLNIYKSIITE